MNILMINPVHPRTPHISAVRAWRFAQELASLEHRVVLLTAPLAGEPPVEIEDINRHVWNTAFVLPCASGTTDASKRGGARVFGKLATAVRMLWEGGALGGWVRRSVLVAGLLGEMFEPDVVWCTFGKMEAVFAARRIATLAGRPWVLDVKDNWELYVPRGLRRLMVWRTRGWAAVTANAQFTAVKARQWQRTEPTVVYSGVDDAFYERAIAALSPTTLFRINLIGSLYHRGHLCVFLKGLRRWSAGMCKTDSATIELCYMGADNAMLDEELERHPLDLAVRRFGYVNVGELAVNCQQGAVNAYIAHSGGFHHKLLELLACGRPLLTVPQEDDESRSLIRQADGLLIEAADEAAVEAGLAQVYRNWINGFAAGVAPSMPARQHSWQSQAQQLETVLTAVITLDGKKI